MVLISIHPFAPRKILLAIVAYLCFSALCFADPLLMVHRYANPHQHLSAANTPAPALPEPLVRQNPWDTTPELRPLESIAWNQTDVRLTEAGKIGLQPTVASSVFRKAMCDLRATGFEVATVAWPNLPLPGEH
jgi:hypothetical protein